DTSYLTNLGQQLLAQGPSLVIITRGALGALLMTRKHTVLVMSAPQQVLDTTGAGDAFMGAILCRLLQRGWAAGTRLAALNTPELQELGEFANKTAGISCTRYGGVASLPYLLEVEKRPSL
ncbi:MAG: carbohydrate kinase family protein, partial [Ktedonobacteraceae bacterium]